MKVRTLTAVVYEVGGETLLPGVHEVSSELAEDLISAGVADRVDVTEDAEEPDPSEAEEKEDPEDSSEDIPGVEVVGEHSMDPGQKGKPKNRP